MTVCTSSEMAPLTSIREIISAISFDDSDVISSGGGMQGNRDACISDLQYDSRRVKDGCLFCALPGVHTDGKRFIKKAIQRGASAILCESPAPPLPHNIGVYTVPPSITTPDSPPILRIMALCAAALFDSPAKKLFMIGVTGTDGKSTTVAFIHQLLSRLAIPAGYWSTVGYHDSTMLHNNAIRQSTPESPDVHRAMYAIHKNAAHVAVIETTSHGLSKKTNRLYGMQFNIGILTNIDQEHLEFHGTMEQYAKDKSMLFSQLYKDGVGIIQPTEPYIRLFQHALNTSGASLCTYGINSTTTQYTINNVRADINTISGTLIHRHHKKKTLPITVHCAGTHNAENALAAIIAVHQYGIPLEDICKHVPFLTTPEGRLHIVRTNLSITPIVDYAHTPGSFRKVLPMAKKLTTGRLIVVFGSAGERDVQKRSVQGSIADEYADIIILTDEDPREESRTAILQDIASGCTQHTIKDSTLFLIPNRSDAIHHSLAMAKSQDVILYLGKGHEKSIQYADRTIEWDEAKIVSDAIDAMSHHASWNTQQ